MRGDSTHLVVHPLEEDLLWSKGIERLDRIDVVAVGAEEGHQLGRRLEVEVCEDRRLDNLPQQPEAQVGRAREDVVRSDVDDAAADGPRGVDRHVEVLNDFIDGKGLEAAGVHCAHVDGLADCAVDELAQDDAVAQHVEERKVLRLDVDGKEMRHVIIISLRRREAAIHRSRG